MSSATIETTRTRSKVSTKTMEESPNRNSKSLRRTTSSPLAAAPRSIMSVPNIMAVLALLGLGIMIYCANAISKTPQLRSHVYHSSYKSSSGELVTPPLSPRSEVIQGTELYFMMPTTETKGVLLFFHGCHHAGGQDMFELPEDRIVALSALNRGLAVLAPTSINRKTGCWGHKDADTFKENQLVEKWMTSVGLPPTLPRMGMGASSGGSFLFAVYQSLGLSSMAPYISGKGFTDSQLATGNVPPTIFVYMAKDTHTAEQVSENHAALLKAGVASEKVAVYPHALTPELCARRLPEFGDRRCQAFLRDVVAQRSLIHGNDYRVITSYQGGDWKAVMEKHKLNANAGATKSFGGQSWMWASVEEEIAASFGIHEMTAEHHAQVLDFLMKHAGIQVKSKNEK